MSDLAIDFDFDEGFNDYSPEEQADDLMKQKNPIKPVNTVNFDLDDIPF